MDNNPNLEQQIAQIAKIVTATSLFSLISISILSLKIKHYQPKTKKILFALICAITISCTVFLAGSTIFLNTVSSSKGPVHYHADFEIWQCGQKQNLKDPHGLSNKVGSSTVHEHNDDRIHIEGVIVKPQDTNLGNFFNILGAKLQKDLLSFESNEGQVVLKNGQSCNNMPALLQVFVYKVQKKQIIQVKLQNPATYIISPESNVPPGDCIIIELDVEKEKTEKLCQSLETAIQTGKLYGH